MAVNIICPKCNKECYPHIQQKGDKVFCDLCREEIAVNHFIKVQLKSARQFQKTSSQESFSLKCENPDCNYVGRPVLLEDDDGEKLYCCKQCYVAFENLSPVFINMLNTYLPKK